MSRQVCPTEILFLILFPYQENNLHVQCLSPSVKHILLRVHDLAGSIHPTPYLVVCHPIQRVCFDLNAKHFLHLGSICKSRTMIVVANPSFLLQPRGSVLSFIQTVTHNCLRLYADILSCDIFAAAFPAKYIETPIARMAIRHVTRSLNGSNPEAPHFKSWEITQPPFLTGRFSSSLQTNGAQLRPHPMSPRYVNTAFEELIYRPAPAMPLRESDPVQWIRALDAQKKTSRVPWIFNTLINELEYRAGLSRLTSFPPEAHIAMSGCCSIECKFCSYVHQNASPEYLSLAQAKQFMPLKSLHTLRFSSGLGEPTLNPDLSEIIQWASSEFPHIILNFFTNGLLLNRKSLLNALLGKVRWINVSLNAATSAIWQLMCGRDQFDRLTNNLTRLHEIKELHKTLLPIVHGSMVINSMNIHQLPKMPELCRRLGIDKFTVIPFYSMDFQISKKLNHQDSLENFRHQYDSLYGDTISKAEFYGVSLELPRSSRELSVRFGLEEREFFDFARVGETLPYEICNLLPLGLIEDRNSRQCPDVWRQLLIGHTYRNQMGFGRFSHFRYPCLGPLCFIDLSLSAGINPGKPHTFYDLHNHPLFVFLRESQLQPGKNNTCDLCRKIDSRNPAAYSQLMNNLSEFQKKVEAEVYDFNRRIHRV